LRGLKRLKVERVEKFRPPYWFVDIATAPILGEYAQDLTLPSSPRLLP